MSATAVTAAVVETGGAAFALGELELGGLQASEVRVRIAASGICHTDLLIRDGSFPTQLPGHPPGRHDRALARGPAGPLALLRPVELRHRRHRARAQRRGDPRRHPVELWRAGRLPIERLVRAYDFDQINEAAHEALAGDVVKPVLRIG